MGLAFASLFAAACGTSGGLNAADPDPLPATAPDLGAVHRADLAPADLAADRDMSVRSDMATPASDLLVADLAPSSDLARPDLAPYPDLAPSPDLSAPTCTDGIQDGNETAVDCGGSCGSKQVVTFSACIDGSDYFTIEGQNVWWVHRNWQLPGEHPSCPPMYQNVTYVNGQPWTPNWNGGTTQTSMAALLPVGLPSVAATVSVQQTLGRGAVTVSQQPSSANGYTAQILLDDDSFGAADVYAAVVSVTCN